MRGSESVFVFYADESEKESTQLAHLGPWRLWECAFLVSQLVLGTKPYVF